MEILRGKLGVFDGRGGAESKRSRFLKHLSMAADLEARTRHTFSVFEGSSSPSGSLARFCIGNIRRSEISERGARTSASDLERVTGILISTTTAE